MQKIIVEKPYVFVPPHTGWFWPPIIQRLVPRYLEKNYGIVSVEHRGTERLKASIDAGHGVLITPNHCRPCDAFVVGSLTSKVGRPFHTVASWHLFNESPWQTWFLRRCGALSIYREGMDKAAVNASVEILEQARRPLVIFPEGILTRTNDLLGGLMEGTSLIARTAAKRRAKADGAEAGEGKGDAAAKAGRKVVVHPVAMRYFFQGDLVQAIEPVLTEIESRLSWRPRKGETLFERIYRIGEALLSLKEVEYFGRPRVGSIAERQVALIDRLLMPLEQEWLNGTREPHTAARVKRLRQAILPDLVKGEINDAERDRRWKQLGDLYLAQQIANYPTDYVRANALPERFLETVERFEEDLTDRVRIHRPMRAVVQVGEAIEVPAGRERGAAASGGGGGDPLMKQIEEQIRLMLAKLAEESGPAVEIGANAAR
ncbi:MAG: 1-acyl-sn-glycerol-3-phosphate acyltransferase [Planctomycetota bacterium]|nr:1-acyl-sn-glycerol-3-phosphate acyltransferase [Planctomycetota bacterium]